MARTASETLNHDWADDTWTTGTPTTGAKTLATTVESKTGAVDCKAYWSLQVTVNINYAGTTDDISISVYGSTNGTDWDVTAMDFIAGDKSVDPEQLTFMLFNPPAYVQLGFVQSGSTNSHVISTVKYIGYN
jgi:hypothetical protein